MENPQQLAEDYAVRRNHAIGTVEFLHAEKDYLAGYTSRDKEVKDLHDRVKYLYDKNHELEVDNDNLQQEVELLTKSIKQRN